MMKQVMNKRKTPIIVNPLILSKEYLETIKNNAYLGKKGYTIPKIVLSKEDIEFLKKDLILKPEIVGISYGAPGSKDDGAFPVFRENEKKIYLPRFYGIERYGIPNKNEIESGMDINIPFVKSLRDYQEDIVTKYMAHVVERPSGGILQVYTGAGKCLGKNTPILMFDGTVKFVQDILVGDQIMGDDSTPRNVLTLARGRETMYKVQYENDESYIVNESHILSLKNQETILDISVLDYLALEKNDNDKLYGYRVPIIFEKKPLEILPYLFGYWLKRYNNKYIPHHYLCNSSENQLKLLAGIIDSIGHRYNNYYKILEIGNEVISYNIVYLARSLGFHAYKFSMKNWKNNKNYFVVNIRGKELYKIPVLNPSKKINKNDSNDDLLKYDIRLEKIPEDDYYGFEIDGNHRFVLGDFTVTHNTVMAIKLITLLKKKTMILVHKEFLMNQWIERIQEYAPEARIGKIQASTYDVDDKDIVIAMIQTMYNRTFPESTYTQFGFTIIDEVHRIGSEEFSKTLLRTITPYMLGISATVERKDKLTKLLYMFIGPLVYSTEKPPDDPVFVRGIEFKTNDCEFNETELDYRGKPKFSTMISKLCDYGPRKDFLVKVTQDLCLENPESQIMILAHNRALLTYLYESINHRNFATVGYYVGGMKAHQLKETEEKNIVLATYAMAAEALDIKTLSILILATPKTDIVQSVGRILRMKHERPIVVDIIDSHDIFKNQWSRRKAYYRKCNYRIRSIDSFKYQGFELDWEKDTTWRHVFEPKKNHINDNLERESDTEIENPTTIFNGKCMISELLF